MHRLINLILIAAIAVVGARVYTTWSLEEPQIAAEPRGRGPQGSEIPSTARTPAPPRLASAIAERDLFDESRRAVTDTSEVSAPLPPPDVELVGVLLIGGAHEALIKEKGQEKSRHVVPGDAVGDYTVVAISPTEVVLASPAGEKLPLPLKLKLSGQAPPPQHRVGTPTPAAPTSAGVPTAGQPANLRTTPTVQSPVANVRERLKELRRRRREQTGEVDQ
jgi:hypothetical protein